MSWSEDDELRFSIKDAMRGVKLPMLKVRLAEEDRTKLAQAVLERFKLSGFYSHSAQPEAVLDARQLGFIQGAPFAL